MAAAWRTPTAAGCSGLTSDPLGAVIDTLRNDVTLQDEQQKTFEGRLDEVALRLRPRVVFDPQPSTAESRAREREPEGDVPQPAVGGDWGRGLG